MSEQPSETVFTIRRLNSDIRAIIEQGFTAGGVWVSGNALDVKKSAQGHVYFDLEDNRQTVRCFIPKRNTNSLGFSLERQMIIQVYGQVSYYEQTGEAQIVVEQVTLIKRGKRTDFREVERYLAKLGLWPKQPKKPLRDIHTIALISGTDSQAVEDFRLNYEREGGNGTIISFAVALSGESAPREIADMIQKINIEALADVIVLTRGGGREVDISVFDDLLVAEAIARSSIHVWTGIGHASDKTVADHIADFSASTPSEVAIQLARLDIIPTKAANALSPLVMGLIIVVVVLAIAVLVLIASG